MKMSLSTLLFIIFLILKLTGLITWSWIWVTSPLWIPALLIGATVLLAVVFGLPISIKRRRK